MRDPVRQVFLNFSSPADTGVPVDSLWKHSWLCSFPLELPVWHDEQLDVRCNYIFLGYIVSPFSITISRLSFLVQTNLSSSLWLRFIQSIYLQHKQIKEQHVWLIFQSLTIAFSTSRTLYRGRASWRSAARCRPRWSSLEDWRDFGKPWRWRARLSIATTSPHPPATSASRS